MALLEALFIRRATLAAVRMVRRLLITLVVLTLLALVGNAYVGRLAERKAGEQIQAKLGLASPPTVRIDAFPILIRVLQGHIPHISVDGEGLDIEGLQVDRFHLRVSGIRASLSDLTRGVDRLRVSGGEAWAEVTQDSVNAYLARQKEKGRVQFGDGLVRVTSTASYLGVPRKLEATGTLEIQGSELVFRASEVRVDGGDPPPGFAPRARSDSSFRVDLPALPGGIHPKTVTVRTGVARFEAVVGATTLDFEKI